ICLARRHPILVIESRPPSEQQWNENYQDQQRDQQPGCAIAEVDGVTDAESFLHQQRRIVRIVVDLAQFPTLIRRAIAAAAGLLADAGSAPERRRARRGSSPSPRSGGGWRGGSAPSSPPFRPSARGETRPR